ncbi:phospholipase D-like domain-containing protein [Mycoplasmopsis columbinasalis]|uniref:Cardiolipin synthase n=1 Tax=Mycoplasmopsis columbinasalis TaxID=114880 RepID=A0A449BAP0_9BACT|nr:phospholipase D-like domain-containing protein [Mycoplasmopsis columbinasalis]VEU78097.1 Cardiolipin synthase [Mycoplasmopsis columbinasalis]
MFKKTLGFLVYSLEALLFLFALIVVLYFTYIYDQNLFVAFTFFSYFVNSLVAIWIFLQTRTEATKLSWILILMLFPIIGNIFFLTFGAKYRNKKEKTLNANPTFQLKSYSSLFTKQHVFDAHIQTLESLNKTISLDGKYKIFQRTGDFFNDLFRALKNAKSHIFIISYIIKHGEILRTFIDILKEKAKEGVKIYWLIDDFGRTTVSKRFFLNNLKKHINFEIVYISKVLYPFVYSQNFYRNHQKFYVIDSKIVYAGGCNLSDEYVGLSRKYGDWIDLNFKIEGPQINAYILQFLKMWNIFDRKNIIKSVPKVFFNTEFTDFEPNANSLLVADSPIYEASSIEYNLLSLLTSAKKSVKIVTPYFSPPSSLFNILKLLLEGGVSVEVYFPGLPDKKLVWKTSLNLLSKLEAVGLKLYLTKDVFIHTKCGVIDDKIGWMGSANIDMRSMYSQYEIMDIITGEAVSQIIEQIEVYKSKSQLNSLDPISIKANLLTDFFFEALRPLI